MELESWDYIGPLISYALVSIGCEIVPMQNDYVCYYGGVYGYVDCDGRVVVPVEYDDADSEIFGLVERNDKWGLVDLENKLIISLEHERTRRKLRYSRSEYDYIEILPNKLWQYGDYLLISVQDGFLVRHIFGEWLVKEPLQYNDALLLIVGESNF